jgi:predicted ATPase
VQIADPFAAIALKGVFEALMEAGTVLVCTSNSAPWDLNPHGVAEELFDEFSRSLLAAVDPVELSAARDYRLSFASQVRVASTQSPGFFSTWPACRELRCAQPFAAAGRPHPAHGQACSCRASTCAPVNWPAPAGCVLNYSALSSSVHCC